MAKKARKAVASKARKTKTAASKKRPTVKVRRKAAAPSKTKSAATKKPANTAKKPAAQPIAIAKPPESFSHKIAGAFGAVVDTLVDADRLHHTLEPDISREPE